MADDPKFEETIHKFEAAGFVVVLQQIDSGRYLANAVNARKGTPGPVGLGDTLDDAVSAAWRRFQENEETYLGSLEASTT